MSFIEIIDVKKSYGPVNALNGVNLSLEQGQQYAIQGASGSGKSTLLYLLGGLDRPTQGEIRIEGRPLQSLSDEALAQFRNRWVGFVFQFHFLLPSMNCLNNMLLPAKIGGCEMAAVEKKVRELSEVLGVTHCLKKFPFELSGGEQQRVNIIRALSLRPRMLLCDEPTGNLDSENSQKVTHLLKQLAQEFGSTLIVVTHDPMVVSNFDNILKMRDGKLMEDSPPPLHHA